MCGLYLLNQYMSMVAWCYHVHNSLYLGRVKEKETIPQTRVVINNYEGMRTNINDLSTEILARVVYGKFYDSHILLSMNRAKETGLLLAKADHWTTKWETYIESSWQMDGIGEKMPVHSTRLIRWDYIHRLTLSWVEYKTDGLRLIIFKI